MLTVNAAKHAGVDAFAMIHDCYGTHAGDAETLATILRDAFVDLYADRDVLADFAKEIGGDASTAPERGSLDVTEVRGSKYFFS